MDNLDERKENVSTMQKDHHEDRDDAGEYPTFEIPRVTRSEPVNELWALGHLITEGKPYDTFFQSKLSSEMLRFFSIFKNFLQVYKSSTLPDNLEQKAREVLSSMEKYQQSLDKVQEYFSTGDKSVISEGLKKAAEAVEELAIAYEEYVKMQNPTVSKKCTNCGHPNPLGTIYCFSCESKFTLTDEEIPMEFALFKLKYPKPLVSIGAAPFPNCLAEIYDNYGKFTGGTLPKEKYLESMDWIITQFELSRQKLEREMYQASYEVLDSTTMLIDGMDAVKKRLEKIRDKVAFDQLEMITKEWNNLLASAFTIIRSRESAQEEQKQ
jgi:hypothetical protein